MESKLEMGRKREGLVESWVVGGVGLEEKSIGCRYEGFEDVCGSCVHVWEFQAAAEEPPMSSLLQIHRITVK